MKSTPLKEEIKPYKKAIYFTITAGLGILGMLAFYKEIIQLINYFEFLKFLNIFLSTLMVLLGFSWVQSGIHELDIAAYWLRTTHYKPPHDFSIIGSIVGIGCVIGILAFSAKWIIIFGFIFFFYLLVDLYWWKIRKTNYRKAIDSAKKHVKDKNNRYYDKKVPLLEGINEMETFYIRRPHYQRIYIAIGFTALALAILLSDSIIGEVTAKVIAYIIFIIQVIFGEILIQNWRIVRDRRLQKFKEQFEYGYND